MDSCVRNPPLFSLKERVLLFFFIYFFYFLFVKNGGRKTFSVFFLFFFDFFRFLDLIIFLRKMCFFFVCSNLPHLSPAYPLLTLTRGTRKLKVLPPGSPGWIAFVIYVRRWRASGRPGPTPYPAPFP